MFPKHNGVATILESFALNFANFCTIDKQITPLECKLKQNFFFVTVKLIAYIFCTVKVCSNPCVDPYMYFFLLSMCEEELISNPKINTF